MKFGRSNFRRTVYLIFIGSSASAFSSIAHAQAPDEASAAIDREIVVTARGREERLKDVPLSITAVSAETLQTLDIRDTSSLANFVPGLEFSDFSLGRNDRGSGRSLIFRGLNLADSSGVKAGALVFLDGAPVIGGEVPIGDYVGRVEVLRGPQNVYFGRSTLSGAISYVTRTIQDEMQVSGQAKLDHFGGYDLDASVSGALAGDALRVAVTGRYSDLAAKFKNNFPGGDRLGARKTKSIAVLLQSNPTDRLAFKGFFNYFENDDNHNAAINFPSTRTNCNIGGVQDYYCGEIPSPDTGYIYTNTILSPQAKAALFHSASGTTIDEDAFDEKFGMQRTSYQAHFVAAYDLGFAELKSITAYHQDAVNSSSDIYLQPPNLARTTLTTSQATYRQHISDFSTELRLNSSGSGPLSWQAGATYIDTKSDTQIFSFQERNFIPQNPSAFFPSSDDAWAWGVFGGLSYKPFDALTVSAEGRYQEDNRTSVARNAAGESLLKAKFTSFSPRVSAVWEVAPTTNIYASWATGVRPGGFNRQLISSSPNVVQQVIAFAGAAPINFAEEKLEVYELGVKGAWLDNRLNGDLNLYYGTLTNQQVGITVPVILDDGNLNNVALVSNVGKTRIYGAEFSGSFRVSDLLTLGTTFAYNETKIKDYICTTCIQYLGNSDVTGNHLAGSPRYSASFTADLQGDVGNTGARWFAHGDYAYRGRIFLREINRAWIKPAHLLNARAGVELESITYELFVTNILNEKAFTGVLLSNDTVTGRPNALRGGLRDPRTLGARVRFSF